MRLLVGFLSFVMIVLSSNAFIVQIMDGGARDEGAVNVIPYDGPLLYAQPMWAIMATFVVGFLLITRRVKMGSLLHPILLLIILSVISLFWAEFPLVTLKTSLILLPAYFLINAQVDLYGWVYSLNFLKNSLFFILFSSLLEVLFLPNYGISVGAHSGAWQGAFDHKNGMGNFAALAFLLFWWRFLIVKSPIALCYAGIAVICLVGSQSGTGIANVVLSAVVLAFMSMSWGARTMYKFRYFVLITALLFSLAAVFVATFSDQTEFLGKDSSFTGRGGIWIFMFSKILDHPFFGVGYNQFFPLILKDDAEFRATVGFVATSPHNGFLDVLFSFGFVGLILVGWMLIKGLKIKYPDAIFKLVMSYWLFYILQNTTEDRLVGLNIYFIFMIYLFAIERSKYGSKKNIVIKRSEVASVYASKGASTI